jgi:hypothetical protein
MALAVSHSYKRQEQVTLNPASVPGLGVSVETFTVADLVTEDFVLVQAPNLETGVKLISARVTAADTLELTFQNFTGSAVNPASQLFHLIVL